MTALRQKQPLKLLRATNQFYSRCDSADHSLVCIEIIERHTPRSEARLDREIDPEQAHGSIARTAPDLKLPA